MSKADMHQDSSIYLSVFRECARLGTVGQGNLLYSHVIERGFDTDIFVCNALIYMYAKCRCVADARYVFQRSEKTDAVAWNSLITGFVQSGGDEEALDLFWRMQDVGMEPNKVTLSSIVKACSNCVAFQKGMIIHSYMLEISSDLDLVIANTLIDMYLRCGSFSDAFLLNERTPKRTLVTWNIMISGLVQQGHSIEALQCCNDMLQGGFLPDQITVVSCLKACASITDIVLGKLMHMHTVEALFADSPVVNSLLDMYATCGALEDALALFNESQRHDTVSWNVIIKGLIQNGHKLEALQLFQQMQQEGVVLTVVTYGCILKACSSLSALNIGKMLHACVTGNRFFIDVHMSNALIDMYMKCGEIGYAHKTFNKHSQQDLTAWNIMIMGYIHIDQAEEAIRFFSQLYQRDLEPDRITFISILKACTISGALGQGKLVHACCLLMAMESKISIVNSLVDMYGKVGNIADAQNVFGKSEKRNVVTWSAMMSGHAEQCNYRLVLESFHEMQMEGIKPDAVTFSCLLCACQQLGKIEEGYFHLKAMFEDHGVNPTVEHWNCVVDLFGRAGFLHKASEVLTNMPFQSNSIGWLSLLNHCKTHGAIELGRKCLFQISQDHGEYATGLVLLSNIHDNFCMWDDTNLIKEEMRSTNLCKKPGRAFIETENKMHVFVVGDKSHMQNSDIYAKMKRLLVRLLHEGHMPCLP